MSSSLFLRSGPITTQPGGYHFQCTFGPLTGENIMKIYQVEEGLSRCLGPKTYTAMTNIRLLVHEQQPRRCFGCCEGPHNDTSIFLHDIETMNERSQQCLDCFNILCLVRGISNPTACCICYYCCGGDLPHYITVGGGFGQLSLKFKEQDIPAAAADLSSLILQTKSSK